MNIYLDIETIPDQREETFQRIKANLEPPGNMSKQETIDAWWKDKANDLVDEKMAKTSLDGLYGQIFCIGMAVDDEEPIILNGEEELILSLFYHGVGTPENYKFIGHNILKFDLPFIRHRAIVNQVEQTYNFDGMRFNSEDVYDTMQGWAGYGNYVSLDNLCYGLGIDTPKTDLDGSKVWQYVKDGREEEVYEYCKRDVVAVREVYKRMTGGK